MLYDFHKKERIQIYVKDDICVHKAHMAKNKRDIYEEPCLENKLNTI
jgi:hypothetical protein